MVVYSVPEGCLLGQSAEERQKTMAQINSLFKMTGFPHHIIPLEMVSIPKTVDIMVMNYDVHCGFDGFVSPRE